MLRLGEHADTCPACGGQPPAGWAVVRGGLEYGSGHSALTDGEGEGGGQVVGAERFGEIRIIILTKIAIAI